MLNHYKASPFRARLGRGVERSEGVRLGMLWQTHPRGFVAAGLTARRRPIRPTGVRQSTRTNATGVGVWPWWGE